MAFTYVAVEFEVYSVAVASVITLRLSNGWPNGVPPLTYQVLGEPVGYEPCLYTPILIGRGLSIDNTGLPTNTTPNGGTIEFALDENTWSWVAPTNFWLGHEFRIYEGTSATGDRADLTLLYTGRVAGHTHDTVRVRVQTTDAGFDLDKALVDVFYVQPAGGGGGDHFPLGILGKPRPRLWGRVLNLEPALIDDANLVYEVAYSSFGDLDSGSSSILDNITDVRIGEVSWEEVTGAPVQGQWSQSQTRLGNVIPQGCFALGAPPIGGDVRCDAQAVGWEDMTTPRLVSDIALIAGVSVDMAAIAAWMGDGGGYQIGFYTGTEPINCNEALSKICGGNASFYDYNTAGEIYGAAWRPALTASLTLDETNVLSAEVLEQLPSAWRIRVEFAPNWNPTTQFEEGATDAQRKARSATGITFEPHYEDASIKDVQPRAVDVPLVKSLFWSANGAFELTNRLLRLWGSKSEARQVINVTVRQLSASQITLFDSVALDYMMLGGNFRIVSAVLSIGGGAHQLQLWGAGTALLSSGSPDPSSGPGALPFGINGVAILRSEVFVIPSENLKITVVGPGGGAAGTGSFALSHGGSGSMLIKWLTGLTIGNTLTITVGLGGLGSWFSAGVGDGHPGSGPSIVASGTETISTLTAYPGGAGWGGYAASPPPMPGMGGALATGGDINSVGNNSTVGDAGLDGGHGPSLFGNYGWGGLAGHDLYGNGIGSGQDGIVVIEWADHL